MAISYAVTDTTRTNARVMTNVIDLTIKSTRTGIIEIGPLANIGSGASLGYMTDKVEPYRVDHIMIVPTAKAYTVSLHAKIDGTTWEKLAADIVRITGDKEILIITTLKDIIHRYSIKITLTTLVASDVVYTVYIPVRVAGETTI